MVFAEALHRQFALAACAFTMLAASASASAQAPAALNPAWYGTWKSGSGETLHITASHLGHEWQGTDKLGKPTRRIAMSAWAADLKDASPDVSLFAYNGERLTHEGVRKHAQSGKDGKSDRSSTSSQRTAREAAETLPPGRYRVVQEVMAGECGDARYVVEGDLLLRLNTCSTRPSVERFNRVRR
jgi:hypothetical protein